MVKVAGFPRPLYPPDASRHGKTPSVDGPDVLAYKRTVSRAGRWPWQRFDDAFSNGFSHGKGGNVADTGIAGVQRQQHLDATGWVGEKTFNTLRSIRVPDGLPHAGEPAMDDYAAALVDEAFELFGGHEPPPAASSTLRELALEHATGELGRTENPAGSNLQPYGAWYGSNGVPWCAIFCTWAYETAAPDDSPTFDPSSARYAYVPYIVADARAGRYGLQTTDDPIPGDLVCYDWQGTGAEYDHVGLFEAWQAGSSSTFTAIEGNTSASNYSNGGQVLRCTRRVQDQATVFVRVAE
jgi:hypothetical protein